MARRSLFSQMASLGEDALGRLAQNPTTNRMVQSAVELKDRVDELARQVRGLERLEQRLARVEERVDALEQPGATPTEPPTGTATAATTTKASGS